MKLVLALIFYIVCVIGPVIFWLWFFRWRDQGEPEPKKFLFRLFLWGMLAALFTVGVLLTVQFLIYGEHSGRIYDLFGEAITVTFFTSVVIVILAVVEEAVKFFILRFSAYYSSYFTQILDGVLYGVCIGLGFAFVENTGYFLRALSRNFDSFELLSLALSRALLPLLMHITTAGIIGLYLGRRKFSRDHSHRLVIKGFLIAVLIHVIFNFSLIGFEIQGLPIAIGVVVLGLAYLIRQLNQADNKMVWKLRYK